MNSIQLTEKDMRAIINYIKPLVAKDMKFFLGLESYKRKYIAKFVRYERTLRKCITNGKIITWTRVGKKGWDSIKNAIANSKK
jgi:hypothetical protein